MEDEKGEEWYRETMNTMLSRQVNGAQLLKFISQAEKEHASEGVLQYFNVVRLLDSGNMSSALAAVEVMRSDCAINGSEKPWYLDAAETAVQIPVSK